MSKEYEKKINVTTTINSETTPNYLEKFDATLNTGLWTASGIGVETVDTNSAAAFKGATGLRLITQPTTPAINDFAQAKAFFPKIPHKYIRVSCMVKILENDDHDFTLFLTNEQEDTKNEFKIRFDYGQTRTYINTSTGEIQIGGTTWDYDRWVYVAITADIKNGKYVEAQVMENVFDLSAYTTADLTIASNTRSISVRLHNIAVGAAVATVYVDELYLEYL